MGDWVMGDWVILWDRSWRRENETAGDADIFGRDTEISRVHQAIGKLQNRDDRFWRRDLAVSGENDQRFLNRAMVLMTEFGKMETEPMA